jgi:fatty-acid desaturase
MHGFLYSPVSRGASALSVLEPWNRSWFYCAPGESTTLIWVILVHAAAMAGLLLLPFPGWLVLGIAAGLLSLGDLGTTITYHRSLAHQAVVLRPVVEQVLIIFAVFNDSGAPLNWWATTAIIMS